ncbi:MAG: outer membrane beta-barrel protein [Treponema sp.]|nr:outer membrane beta-barrel protein [Treponema sp.]
MKMIKKIILSTAILLIAGCAAFASGGRYTAITFSAPYNNLGTTITTPGLPKQSYDQEFNDIGFGIVSCNFNRGLFKPYSSVDITFTQKYQIGPVKFSKDDLETLDMKIWKMNALFGPGFTLVDTGSMNLLLAPGIHFDMMQVKQPNDTSFYMTFGLGLDAMFNWFIGNSLGITGGVGLSYDFFGFSDRSFSSQAKQTNTEYKYTNYTVIPRIGIAFKY